MSCKAGGASSDHSSLSMLSIRCLHCPSYHHKRSDCLFATELPAAKAIRKQSYKHCHNCVLPQAVPYRGTGFYGDRGGHGHGRGCLLHSIECSLTVGIFGHRNAACLYTPYVLLQIDCQPSSACVQTIQSVQMAGMMPTCFARKKTLCWSQPKKARLGSAWLG